MVVDYISGIIGTEMVVCGGGSVGREMDLTGVTG